MSFIINTLKTLNRSVFGKAMIGLLLLFTVGNMNELSGEQWCDSAASHYNPYTHTLTVGGFSTKCKPAPQPSGAIWGLVPCPRTLWHKDRSRPLISKQLGLPPELQLQNGSVNMCEWMGVWKCECLFKKFYIDAVRCSSYDFSSCKHKCLESPNNRMNSWEKVQWKPIKLLQSEMH